jgi:KTSC domain
MPSTVILDFHFDPGSQILQIKFVSGLIYEYMNVSEEVYLEFKNSREKGIYFNKNIKGKYEFEKKSGQ